MSLWLLSGAAIPLCLLASAARCSNHCSETEYAKTVGARPDEVRRGIMRRLNYTATIAPLSLRAAPRGSSPGAVANQTARTLVCRNALRGNHRRERHDAAHCRHESTRNVALASHGGDEPMGCNSDDTNRQQYWSNSRSCHRRSTRSWHHPKQCVVDRYSSTRGGIRWPKK